MTSRDVQFGPSSGCCEAATAYRMDWVYGGEAPRVRLRVLDYSREATALRPRWTIGGYDIDYCPFCGKKLPEVELMPDPPSPIWNGDDDDDDYCGVCKQRNRGCTCLPPEAAYRVKQ